MIDQEFLEKTLKEILEKRSAHLEMYAAAYFKVTDIDPRDVELVEMRDGNLIRWIFREKTK
jgi:hypothetical protein